MTLDSHFRRLEVAGDILALISMAERAFISRGTLYKVERGDPSVSIGIYATVLSILGLAEGLGAAADRRNDRLGLDIDEDRLPQKIQPHSRKRQTPKPLTT